MGLVYTSLSHYNPFTVMVSSRVGRTDVGKSCGDGRVATATGGGYCWECLVTELHTGGLGVMVASLSTGAKAAFVSCPDDRAAMFRDSTALFHGRGG